MNSVQNYGLNSQPTNFKGRIKQKAQRLIDYPLVKNVIRENPAVHPSKLLEIVRTKVKEILAHNKDLQAGVITKEEACDRALNLML